MNEMHKKGRASVGGISAFIAYVYEYRKGKKENNCGFMKVEVRNHMCTIEPHLQVENLAAGEVCKVYGFVRKEGLMNGICWAAAKRRQIESNVWWKQTERIWGARGIPLEKMGRYDFAYRIGRLFWNRVG